MNLALPRQIPITQVTRLVDSTIAEKGAVDSGLARELAVTLVHAPDFESKVGIILKRDFLEIDHLSLPFRRSWSAR